MRLFVFLFALSSWPASAGEFVADAFGLVPKAESYGSRALWAGIQVSTVDGAVPRFQVPEAPDRVLVFAGPKGLVAGKDEGHAVAILLDRHGNLVADGTPVDMRIGEETVGLQTRGGIADHLFHPPPLVRELIIGATSGQRQSTRAMVRVVADIGSISPELTELPQSFPYGAFLSIPTRQLTDRFGNRVAEGTAVSILFDHEDGSHSLATGTASQGQAEARFLSRDIWGQAKVGAYLGRNGSAQKRASIAIPRPMTEPNVLLEPLPAIAALRVTVGPLLTGEGHVLGDGARVLFDASDQDGRVHKAMDWTRDGYASAILTIAAPDKVLELAIASPLGRIDLGRRWAVSKRLDFME